MDPRAWMVLALVGTLLHGPAKAGAHDAGGEGARPVRIAVPAVAIRAKVEPLEIVDGVMLPPSSWDVVGWYEATAGAGQEGTSVFSGWYDHPDSPTNKGAFFMLDQVKHGDRVFIAGDDGLVYNYEVVWVRVYEKATAPLAAIVGPTGGVSLTLITDAPPCRTLGGGCERSTVVRAEFVGKTLPKNAHEARTSIE